MMARDQEAIAPMRPIDRKPLYEQVSDRLREFIDVNRLQPGDRLMSERDLARQLEVGRSSIREAITALRARGLVEVRHGDGIYLLRRPEDLISSLAAELVDTHIDHPAIWETRQALETQCARLAARRATAADLTELDAAMDQMGAEIDAGQPGLAGDRRFHAGVAAASHNPILIRLLHSMQGALDRTAETSLTRPGQPATSLRDHASVLAAIRAGDGTRAADEMLRHLVSTTDSLVAEGQVSSVDAR
ncbi:MAG: GntR family transcriptional regulator, transcriptional repressor for pyruvate dehydrogenase complex [Pseudonocardiales bacterium]|nr:GntR family transcriptional regulator, transcriptional repressor for pyruvate dehydrogenase complex [Pseudonocardiales bacterium]MDX6229242.1 GntR family transcriptional regulator, transcriptional repressor for pyruvate dehydrogenase complex [Frankiales bacterium]